MKTIFTLLFLCITSLCFGQNINGKEYRIFPRTDSVTTSNIGKIAFDADDDKFRFNDGTGWFSFVKEGASSPYWPLSGNFSTTGAQTITMGGNTVFTGNGGFYIGQLGNPVEELRVNVSNSNILTLSPGLFSVSIGTLDFYGISLNDNVNSASLFALEGNNRNRVLVTPSLIEVAGRNSSNVESYMRISNADISFENNGSFIINESLPTLDTAAWVLVREDATGQIKKRSVISLFDGIQVPEGANKTMGTATLSAGTITVNTTAVTATSRIFLTVNGGTLTNVGTPYVSARSAGTSFTITSTNSSDASDVAWLIIEPQ